MKSSISQSNGRSASASTAGAAPQLSEHSIQMMQSSSEEQWTGCSSWFCRPRPKPVHSHFKRRCTIFHDASVGIIKLEEKFDSMYFFDAVENEDELEDELELYPIITTNSIQTKKRVTILEPETMLGYTEDGQVYKPASSTRLLTSLVVTTPPSSLRRMSNTNKKPPSRRLITRMSSRFLRQKSATALKGLQQPRIPIHERGYPGSLSPDELEECKKVVSALKTKDRSYAEQVYSLRDVEEQPYAICRWLRAVKFDSQALLERLEEGKEDFLKAKAQDFYPEIETTLQAPVTAFLKQYPFITSGRAKNGCPVNYFRVGKINAEGILSLVTFEKFEAFMWHQSYHLFQKNVRASQAKDPNVVRMESITVMDLEGLSYSAAMSAEAMDTVKLATKVGDYFPETMHCMIILNAPSYFSVLWGIIKSAIDPRTAKRIQVFSNKKNGYQRLRQMVEESEIPFDYGGSRPSIDKSMADFGAHNKKSKSSSKRMEAEMIYLKRGGTKQQTFDVAAGEVLNICVYTRSSSSAQFTLYNKEQDKNFLFNSNLVGTKEEESTTTTTTVTVTVSPSCTEIGTDIIGPGTFVVQARDLDDATTPNSVSRGHFLVVGEYV